AQSEEQSVHAFLRPFLIAIIVGLCVIVLQWPIIQSAFLVMSHAAEVRLFTADYFHIRIWGAPFTLMKDVIVGWQMGMATLKESLTLQVLIYVMHRAIAIMRFNVFSFAVKGVAAATVISVSSAFV
ncbi:MATE family efflux transporter, partial [Bacillus pumilus]